MDAKEVKKIVRKNSTQSATDKVIFETKLQAAIKEDEDIREFFYCYFNTTEDNRKRIKEILKNLFELI